MTCSKATDQELFALKKSVLQSAPDLGFIGPKRF